MSCPVVLGPLNADGICRCAVCIHNVRGLIFAAANRSRVKRAVAADPTMTPTRASSNLVDRFDAECLAYRKN